YSLALFRGDEAEMARQVAAAQRLPGGFRILATQAYAAMYQGRLARAIELCGQFAAEAKSRTALNGAAANLWSNVAQAAAAFVAGVVNFEGGSSEVAAQRFKTIVDRPNAVLTITVVRAVAPLYYGRALARLGQIEESRKAYDEFFHGFEHADSTLPILVAARA